MEHTKFLILSDSLSTINRIKNKTNPSDVAVFIQNKLDNAKTNNKQITFIWIPGHTGIKENKTADKYAKLAVSNTDTNVLDLIIYDNFKNSIKTLIRKNWHTFWNNQSSKVQN